MLFCLALNCFYLNLLFSIKQDCLRLVLRVDANTSLAYFFGPSFIGFKNKPDRGAYNMFQKSNNEKKLFCHPFLFSLTLNVLVSILPQKYQSQITNPHMGPKIAPNFRTFIGHTLNMITFMGHIYLVSLSFCALSLHVNSTSCAVL